MEWSRRKYSESSPSTESRPIRFPPFSVNHIAPSGPRTMAKGSTPNSSPIGECVPAGSIRSISAEARLATHGPVGTRGEPLGKRIGGRQVVPGRLGGGRHRADRRDEPREGQRSSDEHEEGRVPTPYHVLDIGPRVGLQHAAKVGRPTGAGEALSMLRRCFRPRRASCSPVASSTWRPARCTRVGRSCSTGTTEDVVPAGDAPAGATVDLSARTVLPGLIDCHAHLIGELDDGQGYASLVGRTSAQEALTGVPNARATVLAGVTTVRDVGTFHAFVDLALREAIDAGRQLGPRMMCAGAYITCPGGGGDITGLPANVPVPTTSVGVSVGPEQVRSNVRRIFDAGADMIKVIATGAVLTSGTNPASPSSPRTRSAPPSRKPRRAVPRRRARTRRRGRQPRDPRRRPLDRARLPDRRRDDRADGRARDLSRLRHVRRRLDDPGGTAPRLLGRGHGEDGDDQRRPARESPRP